MRIKTFAVIITMYLVLSCVLGCNSPRLAPTIAPGPAVPTNTPAYTFDGALGHGGTCSGINAPDQLMTPCGIAIANTGDIYLADLGNSRIIRYDSGGNTLQIVGGSGCGDTSSAPGLFNYPFGICVDSANNVYVLDSGNQRVEKFGPAMNFIKQWAGFTDPTGIAADKTGAVYVADTSAGAIKKFDYDGNFLISWSDPGTTYGKFISPCAVAVNDAGTKVYVTDAYNSKVLMFDSSGNFMKEWGGFTAGTAFIWSPHDYGPWGVAVDKQGYVYVCDPPASQIYKYDQDGNYIMNWTVYNAPYYSWPWALAIDINGDVYTVCYNSQVIRYKY